MQTNDTYSKIDIQPLLNDVNEVVKKGVNKLLYDFTLRHLNTELDKCKLEMEFYKSELTNIKELYGLEENVDTAQVAKQVEVFRLYSEGASQRNMDNITITCKTDDVERIQMIMRQTDYTEEQVIQKLIAFNDDHIKVIKDFMGITEKKAPQIKSVNQEIYKQIRGKLDDSMRVYNSEQEVKLAKEIENNTLDRS